MRWAPCLPPTSNNASKMWVCGVIADCCCAEDAGGKVALMRSSTLAALLSSKLRFLVTLHTQFTIACCPTQRDVVKHM